METRAWSKRWGSRPAQWQALPPELLCRVFHYLPDVDRCNARLSCREWDEVFRTPQLWRHRRFKFRGLDEAEGWRAARYLDSLGTHLRHLELEIGMPVVQNARIISLAVEKFLNTKPRGMRLQTFACSGLEFFQTPLYRIARHRVRMVRALCSTLRRHKWLERVNLACCQMGREDGSRVLKALTFHCRGPRPGSSKASSSCLSALELRDFFMEDVNVVELLPFLEEIGRFSALRHVGLNYTYLSDAVLERLTQLTVALETLSLSLDGSHLLLITHMTHNNLTVSTAGWQAAAERCPQLRVLVDMRGRFRLMDFQRVLLPGMPLASLGIRTLIASLFFGSEDMLAHIAGLLGYLGSHFCHTLETFHLGWWDYAATWSHREALVRLVRACTSLRCLSLAMNVPLDTLLQVALAASKRSSTELLHVYVTGFDRNITPADVQLKVSRACSQCLVHTGKTIARF